MMLCCLLLKNWLRYTKEMTNGHSKRNAKQMKYCECVRDSRGDAIIIAGCDFSVIGMNPAIGVPFYRHLLFFK